MKIFGIIMMVLVAAFAGTYVLAKSGVDTQYGYAEVSMPEQLNLDKRISLDVGPIGVIPVKWALGFAEQKELELLKNVEGIKVNIYEMNDKVTIEQVYADVKDSFLQLKNGGWEQVVSVNDDDERVAIFTRIEGSSIKGIYVFVVNNEEAIFVNLMGTLTQEDVATISSYRH